MDRSRASSKILFHGLLRKSKCTSIRKHGIVVIIIVNSISFYKTTSVERYFFAKFSQYFCELLENSNSASKYIPKSFKNFTKIYPWQSLAGFYRSNNLMCSVKKGVFRKVFATFIGIKSSVSETLF